MICRAFTSLYSAQLDGCAEESEQLALQQHLRECGGCRRSAAELRSLRWDLAALNPPKATPTLKGEIQIALREEAELRATENRRRQDSIDLWRVRIFSQSIGAVVSLCLFFFVITGVFRPAYHTISLALDAPDAIFSDVVFDDPTMKLKSLLLLPPPPPPVFAPNGDLLSVGASLAEDEEIIATLKVSKDGRASINQIVAPVNDPSVMTKFSNVIMQQASFQPVRPKEYISREAVLIMFSMNVPGRASI
jgi:hypothetical protein